MLVTLSLPSFCEITENDVSKKPVFTKILENEKIDSYRIPTFLIKYVLSFDEDAEDIRPLFNGSHFINFAIYENLPNSYSQIVTSIMNELDKASYTTLIQIVEKNSKVTIRAMVDNDVIRELVVLICDDDEFVALSMTGRMDKNELGKTIAKLNKSKIEVH